MVKKSFNNKHYIKIQSEKILERVNQFENKLYLDLVVNYLTTIMLQEYYVALKSIQK